MPEKEPICQNCEFYTIFHTPGQLWGYYCKLNGTVYDEDFSCEKFQLKEAGNDPEI